jgi:SAM-dependent methyltransferase
MTKDLYEGFAERYDLFHGAFGRYDSEQIRFFQRLLQRHNVQSVLDCACGTGTHLPLFHGLGCEVVGSDISYSMLAQARKNLEGYGLDVPLHMVDFRELPEHFDRAFDAVMCLSSSLLHMPFEAAAIRALGSMRQVLRRGGILVLTQGTTDRQWAEKPRFILAHNDRDLSRVFAIDYVGEGAHYHILDIFHSEKRQELKIWSVDYPRMYLRDDQERLLRAAGFATTTFYGSYDLEPYDRRASNLLIAVASR